MLVVIGCEESGTSRDAFINAGHVAWSCDLEPPRGQYTNCHHKGDIVEFLNRFADKEIDLCILHPDCTRVAVSGNATWAGTQERLEQAQWIYDLWELAIRKSKRVALENPASVIWPELRRRGAVVQFIQPWMFGHPEKKKTGLALYGLPMLKPENNVYEYMLTLPKAQQERLHYMGPSPTRKRDRSKTFEGIAQAFVNQWT